MCVQEKLFPGSSLQGSTAADLSFLLQEKDAEIESLQATLDQREAEKLAHQEELTELRRWVTITKALLVLYMIK